MQLAFDAIGRVKPTTGRSSLARSLGWLVVQHGETFLINPYQTSPIKNVSLPIGATVPDHAETGLLKVKALAAALPAHLAQLDLARTKVILGSHSEPYQCLESSALLTRSILRELVSIPLKGLEIRTASPEILQDIVMLKQFPSLQVTVFLPTDSQAVLDDFHPYSPSLTSRIDLIQQLQDWGIAVTVGLAPLLPIQDIDKFADLLKGFGCNLGVHILQKSPMSTSPSQRKLQTAAKEYGWSGPEYLETVIKLRKRLPGLRTLDLI